MPVSLTDFGKSLLVAVHSLWRSSRIVGILAVAACSLLVSLPLLTTSPWFASHELGHYITRTVEFSRAVADGDWPPRWAGDFYGGAGAPFFQFYPPMSYLLASLFGGFWGESLLGVQILALALHPLAGFGMWKLSMQHTRRPDVSTLAACAFLAAPYRLTDVYIRGDLAESLAIALFPWVLYSYSAIARSADPQRLPTLAARAAVVHAAMILSHALLGVWCSALGAVLIALELLRVLRQKSFERVAFLCLGGCLAPVLAAFYLLPVLAERHLVPLERMLDGLFDPTTCTLLMSDYFGMPDSAMNFGSEASVLLLSAAAAAVIRAPRTRARVVPPLVLAVGLFVLTHEVSTPLYQEGGFEMLVMLQFPWRLLGPATVLAVLAGALGLAALLPATQRTMGLALALGALMTLAGLWPIKLHPYEIDLTSPQAIRAEMTATTVEGVDEYLPRNASLPKSPVKRLIVPSSDYSAQWLDGRNSRHELEVSAAAGTLIPTRLHAFPGWTARTSEGESGVRVLQKDGRVHLLVEQSGKHRFQLALERSPARLWGDRLSLFALAAIVALALLGLLRQREFVRTPLLVGGAS